MRIIVKTRSSSADSETSSAKKSVNDHLKETTFQKPPPKLQEEEQRSLMQILSQTPFQNNNNNNNEKLLVNGGHSDLDNEMRPKIRDQDKRKSQPNLSNVMDLIYTKRPSNDLKKMEMEQVVKKLHESLGDDVGCGTPERVQSRQSRRRNEESREMPILDECGEGGYGGGRQLLMTGQKVKRYNARPKATVELMDLLPRQVKRYNARPKATVELMDLLPRQSNIPVWALFLIRERKRNCKVFAAS